MKTRIPLEKKTYEDAIPDWVLSLHHVSAVSPIVRDGRLRWNTLENLESAFARLKMCRLQDSALLLKFTDVTILSHFFMTFIFWVIEDLWGTSHSL